MQQKSLLLSTLIIFLDPNENEGLMIFTKLFKGKAVGLGIYRL